MTQERLWDTHVGVYSIKNFDPNSVDQESLCREILAFLGGMLEGTWNITHQEPESFYLDGDPDDFVEFLVECGYNPYRDDIEKCINKYYEHLAEQFAAS